MDLLEKKSRDGNVRVPAGDGATDTIDITWRPENKQTVETYAAACGASFNRQVEKILIDHVLAEAKKRRWKKVDDVKGLLKKLAGKHMPLATYVRMTVLRYIMDHPAKDLPPPPPEESIASLKELRPDALVYTVPIHGAKIIASPDPEGGWRGILFDPRIQGSVATWNSRNLGAPVWAKTPYVLKALFVIASRIDDGGVSYFEVPRTGFKISARLDTGSGRFDDGEIIDPPTGRRQKWIRTGWYSLMDVGPFNYLSNVRRIQNMLCRAISCGAGGLNANPPVH